MFYSDSFFRGGRTFLIVTLGSGVMGVIRGRGNADFCLRGRLFSSRYFFILVFIARVWI